MSARGGIFALAALAPAFAGCGVASYVLPQGTRIDAHARCAEGDEFWLPPEAHLSCAAFAVEGAEASPPMPGVEETGASGLESFDADELSSTDASSGDLPLNAPANGSTKSGDALSSLASDEALPLPLIDRPLPAPVTTESEEEALAARERDADLALAAARNALASRQRESTDVTVGLLPDSIERDPEPIPPTPRVLPLQPPAPRSVAAIEPARADYVNAPLSKLAGALHPHGRHPDGRIVRPGLVGGLRHRLFGEHEPPEAVPFVVYERVAPKFFPVPTRPAFEPAQANFVAVSPSLGVGQGLPSAGGFAPPGMAPPPISVPEGPPPPTPAEEALPRPLPTMEALPLPQPGAELPPAPRLDDE